MVPKLYLIGNETDWKTGLHEFHDEVELLSATESGESTPAKRVDFEKRFMSKVDGVFVYHDGDLPENTPMKVMYAHETLGIPVTMWVDSDARKSDIGEWLRDSLHYISDDKYTAMNHLIVEAEEKKKKVIQ